MSETRRIVLDGGIVEMQRQGNLLVAQDGRQIECDQAVHLLAG